MKNYFQTSSALSCFIELNQLAYTTKFLSCGSPKVQRVQVSPSFQLLPQKKILSANIYVCDDDEDAP